MLKNSTYTEKMKMMEELFSCVVKDIKKDLKNDHLKNDRQFFKTYFSNQNLNKITEEELTDGYLRALGKEEDFEELGEFFANRWLIKNTELYDFFERSLSKISSDFTALEILEDIVAEDLMKESIQNFGATKAYIFSVFNSVVFPEKTLNQFKSHAIEEKRQREIDKIQEEKDEQKRKEERNFDQIIARLTDKYEKKLSGLEKKYHTDIATLKKQISNLEHKLLKNK